MVNLIMTKAKIATNIIIVEPYKGKPYLVTYGYIPNSNTPFLNKNATNKCIERGESIEKN